MTPERTPEQAEQVPHGAHDPRTPEDLDSAIKEELARYAPSLPPTDRHEPVPETAHTAVYTTVVHGVSVAFGRPEAEIVEKLPALFRGIGVAFWTTVQGRQDKLRALLEHKELVVRVTPSRALKVVDGNTTLYAALSLGIAPQDIRVSYTVPPEMRTEGEEYHHGTLADVLEVTGSDIA